MHVCTYICIVNLEEAIISTHFRTATDKAGLNILYTAWWLKTIINQALKELGLTHEQYNVMRILKGQHPKQICVKDIAVRMIEKNSNVPRILDRLNEKKLITRAVSDADRRETVMKLTLKGLQVLEQATKVLSETMDASIAMEEQDALLLNTLLEKYRNNKNSND